MKIIDITGPIYEGMWDFGFPHGKFKILQLDFEAFGRKCHQEGFEGMVGSTGTFIETGAFFLGYEKSITTNKIPLEKLVNVDTCILQIPYSSLREKDGRKYISLKDIKAAEKGKICKSSGIIVSTGYGQNWDRKDYIEKSPFFKKSAIDYLLNKEPILLGSDFPSWDNILNLEYIFKRLFKTDIIVIASLINLEKIKKFKVKLIALPIKILDICTCPLRAVVIEE